ncbi:MAG TPA: serine/threonine-protein kinase [Labilithrix sp.]|nr:serine/threonine-protein kinase [Labilithrix sp.]
MATGSGDDDDRKRAAFAPTEDAAAQTLPRDDASFAVNRRHVGRFRIDGELGSGGMADVYRAYDPVLDRAVALKVLHTRRTVGDTQGMRRVLREARAAAALSHPNTVTIFEVGEADGEVFIAMELLEGSVLREVLDRGQASLDQKLRWLLEAARALGAAHERGLVHRDVKPENMFVCATGGLKLLDFGIAKRDDQEGDHADADPTGPSSLRTHAGRRLGTPRYMAPEQHAGLATDARTDEYAWGLVAFELLCGSHVSGAQATVTSEHGLAPDGAASAMRTGELRARVPELAEVVAASIARALEPRKEDRFPSMAPIIEALEARTSTGETGARPAPAPPPAPARRWWLVTAVAAAAVLAAVAVVRPRQGAAISAAPAAANSAACRVRSMQQRHLAPNEQLAVLPDGTVVFVRDPAVGLVVEREVDGGVAPVPRWPQTVLPLKFESVGAGGTSLDGSPAVYLFGRVASGSATIVIFGAQGEVYVTRVGSNSKARAFTSFGTEVVTIVSTGAASDRFDINAGVHLRLAQNNKTVPVEEGDMGETAIAANDTHLGVAYSAGRETHFVLFDEKLERLGDVITALPQATQTWLAFAGDRVVLFWLDAQTPKARLAFTTYSPGDVAFTPSQLAVDEAIVSYSPLTARLPDGSFVLAWVRWSANGGTLRVARVGPGGALEAPSDIAAGATFAQLRATPAPGGLAFTWSDGSGNATIATVACQPPASQSDR